MFNEPTSADLAVIEGEWPGVDVELGQVVGACAVLGSLPPGWEVRDASGQVVYRGADLVLADELYEPVASGGHLVESPGVAA